ncbi:MAG: 5-formyltetrahydrofolate cyclo-ligase, partial [Alphaproteobacteria bacterium]
MTEDAENTAKAVLRIHMRNLRRQLVRDHPEADWQAGDKAPEMLAALNYARPGVIAVYRASGNEMDPRPLADNLAAIGWRLALPVCREFDQPVIFRAWAPGDRLIPDVMNIAAPLDSAMELSPDIVVAPVL